MAPFALFLLAGVLLVWLYLRRLAGRRRLHGRDLWQSSVRHLRRRHWQGARTWSERRRRQKDYATGWKIAPRFLEQEPEGSAPPAPDEEDRR